MAVCARKPLASQVLSTRREFVSEGPECRGTSRALSNLGTRVDVSGRLEVCGCCHKAAAEQLDRAGPTETALTLLLLLVDDPKWEVRKDVADCLMLVPDDDFPRLAARLSQDANSFVRKATERAMDRRRRGREQVQRKRRGLDQVQDQYANIEKMHGSIAAEKAREMAERLYDVLVGATVHDMRNVLAPLKSSISAMLGHLHDNGLDVRLLEKNLTKMSHQAELLERLLEDMRAYSHTCRWRP